MSAKRAPTETFETSQETWDGGRRAFDVVFEAERIATALEQHRLYVIPEEQRGDDPVTGREVLNDSKVKRWEQMELSGQLHLGQLTVALHKENAATFDHEAQSGQLDIYGPMTIVDGRQRSYTLRRALEKHLQTGVAYDPKRKVSVRIYVDLDAGQRRELFNQMNGGRGGDHATSTRVNWLAPSGAASIARSLVARNAHLGEANVNVVLDKVTRKDPRLAGFNTFVEAIRQAFGDSENLTAAEQTEISDYLNKFWTKLVEVLPVLGQRELAERNRLRDKSLLGNALAIYGFMEVAKRLRDERPAKPPLERLEVLGRDRAWFDKDRQHWRDLGVMVAVIDPKTMKITGHKPRNNFQVRRAFANAMAARMPEGNAHKAA
jgi:hypothetical protein